MKRFFYVLSVVFISISLIGCMEVFEYITVEGDKVNITMNITVSKAVMSMMNEDTSDLDYDDEELDEEDMASIFLYETKINKINTAADYGFNISASLEKKYVDDLNYEDTPFLPIKKGSSYYMSFEDVYSYRYKLVVSKTYIKSIKKVVVILDDESVDIDFYDLGDAYLIDIPILELDIDNAVLKIN